MRERHAPCLGEGAAAAPPRCSLHFATLFGAEAAGGVAQQWVGASPSFAAAVVQAVKKWRFMPAESNGAPVARKVALPVKIVEPAFEGSLFTVSK